MVVNLRKFRLVIIAVSLLLVSVPSLGSVLTIAKEGNFSELAVELNASDRDEVNATFADGTSALHWASYHDSVEGVELLIGAGADANALTDLGVTPLWLAAQNGGYEIVRRLLDAGANPNIRLRSGESILMAAAKSGNYAAVEALLQAGADTSDTATRGQNALMWAAARGHAEVVRVLLEFGADPQSITDVRRQFVKTDKATDGHPDYMKWVEQGGSTALMFAASSGDVDTVRALIDGGSDINAVSALGLDAAKLAIYSDRTEVLELLLRSGVNPNSSQAGYTTLHAAVLTGNVTATELLLENGANIESKVEAATATRRESLDLHFHEAFVGATPLWLAARFAEPEIMRLLVEHDADAKFVHQVRYPAGNRDEHYIVDEGGVSVTMAAVGMGNQRLRGGWANSDRNYGGQTLKPRIPESVFLECVQIAVEAGAGLDQVDSNGQSALDVAGSRQYFSIVDFLTSRE